MTTNDGEKTRHAVSGGGQYANCKQDNKAKGDDKRMQATWQK